MKQILFLTIAFFLAGCQSALIQTENAYTEVSRQASIEITQVIEVAPGSARAFLQNGEVISYGQLNLYDINCEIEINTVSEERQIIEPGVFNIVSIAQEESPIVKRKNEKQFMTKPIMIAALNYAWFSNSPVDIKRYYRFRLTAQDPESKPGTVVRAMICRGAQDTPYNAELPTYEQMKAASGKYVKFNLLSFSY